jgi:hypothetical protein
MCIYEAHIRKVHIHTYTEGAYTEEIYGNPNASSVYACFHICTFKEVVIRKCTFIGAFICVVRICAYTHIKRTYTEDAIMEVASFRICTFTEVVVRICVVCICTYTEARIYISVHIRTTHICQVHFRVS